MSPVWTVLSILTIRVLTLPLNFSILTSGLRSNFPSVEHHLSSAKPPHLLFLTETQVSETAYSTPFSVPSYIFYPHLFHIIPVPSTISNEHIVFFVCQLCLSLRLPAYSLRCPSLYPTSLLTANVAKRCLSLFFCCLSVLNFALYVIYGSCFPSFPGSE